MASIKQYEIVLVNLDPTVGREMKKTRPCVILSPNEMNKYLQTIVVAPVTSASRPYPTRVPVIQGNTQGWIAIDQIRTIDRIRIVKSFGQLSSQEIHQVKLVIQETFVE